MNVAGYDDNIDVYVKDPSLTWTKVNTGTVTAINNDIILIEIDISQTATSNEVSVSYNGGTVTAIIVADKLDIHFVLVTPVIGDIKLSFYSLTVNYSTATSYTLNGDLNCAATTCLPNYFCDGTNTCVPCHETCLTCSAASDASACITCESHTKEWNNPSTSCNGL